MKKRITHLLLLASVSILHSQVLPFNPNLKPFYHGVASGDPIEDRVILWTRVTPEHDTLIEGSFVMALDTALQMIVKSGSFSTDSSKDYTVKLDVTGLRSNTTYYYAFTAFGKRSPIGRTKTTPGSRDNNLNEILRFAVVACSNFEGGYFNAYNGIAARNDLDAVIHLGDYIYEYGQGEYRNIHLPDTERDHYPKSELLVKNDYRNRYSQYRLDSDLQRMHQQHPMIAVWDDHETADDAYDTGAGNHQANEGDWEERKRMAKEAYFEWIPIRGEAAHTDLYRRITYGNLMDLFILDTRMDGRVKQPEQFDEPDDSLNPRRMMSTKQYNWLFEGIKSSSARWKVIGNQVIFSDVNVGFAASDPTSYEEVSFYENLFTDNWKGYKIQRNAIIDSLQLNSIDNVVILTGDSHSSWAMDVTKKPVLYPEEQFGYLPQANPYDSTTRQGYNSETGEGSACIEFCTPSISAANYAEELGSDSIAAIFEYFFNNPIPFFPGEPNYNPHLKHVDLDHHGYFILDVRADSVQADFMYTSTVIEPSKDEEWGAGVSSLYLSNRITNASTVSPAPEKPIQDVPAPVFTSINRSESPVLFSLYPNPASQNINLLIGLHEDSDLEIRIQTISGIMIKDIGKFKQTERGVYRIQGIDISDLPIGMYLLQIKNKNSFANIKVFIKE